LHIFTAGLSPTTDQKGIIFLVAARTGTVLEENHHESEKNRILSESLLPDDGNHDAPYPGPSHLRVFTD
jgi:hypothetical protein